MTIALVATILGAICLALMVITDRLMIGDCYRGESNHAWFVSSFAGSLFGLLLTTIVWVVAPFFDVFENVHEIFSMAHDLFIWKGLASLFVGMIGVQILLHYFRCFSEEAHSTAIAAWLAATPIFVFGGMFLFSMFVDIEGVSHTSTSPLWILGVIISTIGLVGFEKITGGPAGNVGTYRKELIKLLSFNVLYAILLKQTFSIDQGTNALGEAIAIMPYYWIGFMAGTRVMLNRRAWLNFKNSWNKHIHFFIWPIFFVEIIGMLVFFFEYVGITELDPTLVTIIMGAHVFIVYIIDLILGRFRHWMELRRYIRLRIGGVVFVTNNLPVPKFDLKTLLLEIFMIAATVIGISLVVLYTNT